MSLDVRTARARISHGHTAAPSAPLTVLAVDDEESVRNVLRRVLERAGYRTAVASDGPSALRAAASLGHLDVLVTDVIMPEMTGDELARQLRLQDPDLTVLYVTGFSERLFMERSVLWENEAFLDKPFSPDALLEAVSLAISGHTTPNHV
ncbi:MAG: response regulator [Vicinamibacterales bacterium]